ncbi:MAG: hypothetical protein NTW38_01205 [Candidatus Aminicenantes bacterium]|nr:hypothetical protein [Candidatus Aminicenantes bacterium]
MTGPDSYGLFRHRGHRYVSIRQFGGAIADLQKAAALVQGRPLEIKPDSVPNQAGTPVSNTQFNIYYHLAFVAAVWFFDRDLAASGPVQKGPVTFVLIQEEGVWRIVHAHFSNDPEPG